MGEGKVSVVVAAYNAAAFLARAVESVLGQTVPVLEVLVVDDASEDDTPAVAAALARRQAQVLYVRREKNGGVSAARNEGIIRARGEWVAFLDADDAWLPEKLARQLAALGRRPDAAWAYCDGWHADAALRPTRHRLSDGLGCTSEGWIYPRLLAGEFVWPSTTIFRREVFEAVGLFDEGLRGCEDWDFFIRVARRYPCVYVPEPLILHRTHPASLTAAQRPVVREHCRRALEKLLSATPDLDPATRRQLERGQRSVEVLKQPVNKPLSLAQQVSILYALNNGYLDDVPISRIRAFEDGFHRYMETAHPEIGRSIMETKDITKETEEALKKAIEEFKATFMAEQAPAPAATPR